MDPVSSNIFKDLDLQVVHITEMRIALVLYALFWLSVDACSTVHYVCKPHRVIAAVLN